MVQYTLFPFLMAALSFGLTSTFRQGFEEMWEGEKRKK
jgi:hypothetical protein